MVERSMMDTMKYRYFIKEHSSLLICGGLFLVFFTLLFILSSYWMY